MKVLLDEDLPHSLRNALPGHDVSTTVYMGWGGLKNGVLLKTLETAGFEVFVTCDKNLPHQQQLRGRRFGVVLLTAQETVMIFKHVPSILRAVHAATPGSFQVVDCGEFRR